MLQNYCFKSFLKTARKPNRAPTSVSVPDYNVPSSNSIFHWISLSLSIFISRPRRIIIIVFNGAVWKTEAQRNTRNEAVGRVKWRDVDLWRVKRESFHADQWLSSWKARKSWPTSRIPRGRFSWGGWRRGRCCCRMGIEHVGAALEQEISRGKFRGRDSTHARLLQIYDAFLSPLYLRTFCRSFGSFVTSFSRFLHFLYSFSWERNFEFTLASICNLFHIDSESGNWQSVGKVNFRKDIGKYFSISWQWNLLLLMK